MHPNGLAFVFLWMYSTLSLLTAGQNTVNVADTSGTTCTQSSTYPSQGPSCNAANGDTGGVYSGTNCIHTDTSVADREPWFEVDLGKEFLVSSVKVWARSKQKLRLYPFNITVDGSYCGQARSEPVTREVTVACGRALWGRKVRLTRERKKGNDFALNLCEMEVHTPASECDTGYHGKDCRSPCSDTCGGEQGNKLCLKSTGKCRAGCVAGYYGDQCDTKCESRTSRCTECSQRDGWCTACSGNLQPPECTACSGNFQSPGCTDCLEGRWGNTCEEYCNPKCVSATCGRDDGHCDECRRGYRGDKCDQPCSSISTNRRCEECSQNGVCTRCSSNFKPPGCTDCEDGYYKESDSNCRQCSNNCVDRKCDTDSGRCNGCPEGRWGNTCEKHCNSKCVSATCGRDDGHCDGCKHGYHEDKCDQRCSSIGTNRRCGECSQIGVCTRCSSNFKAPGCTDCEDGYYKQSDSNCEPCSDNCVDRKCDTDSGRCNGCPDGRWGETCEKDCYNCVSATCGRDDGHCGDCQSGWWGDRCYDACTDNQHHCATSTCERVEGKCYGCDSGYHGDRCDQECKSIQDNCATCSQAGVCTGCAGNTVYPDCSECLDGYYRERSANSSAPCSNCTWQCGGDTPCDKATGDCDQCPVGKEGKRCQQECQPGSYGKGCTSYCGSCQVNTTCHHESGECPKGCAEGYGGALCMQATAGDEGAEIGGLVLAGIVGGVLAIHAIIALIVFGFRASIKRRCRCDWRNWCSQCNWCNWRNWRNWCSQCHWRNWCNLKSAESGANAEEVPMAVSAEAGTSHGDVYENIGISSSDGEPSVPKKPTKGRERNNETPEEEEENLPVYGDDARDDARDDEREVVYENIKPTFLRLDNLHATIAEKLSQGTFKDEFGRLDPVKDFPVHIGKKVEQKSRNRFKNIVPYDKNRVKLPVDGNGASDYINASFIMSANSTKGLKSKKAPYIAAQGPKHNTVNDFWRMVWQEGVTDIVMLTNVKESGEKKCHEYWPALGASLDAGHVKVTALEEDTRAHYVIRTFDVTPAKGGTGRVVTQYHYVSWPDHDVPAATPLVDFWRHVRARAPRQPSAPPLLVHCSAGVGRTGTYIALDVTIDKAQNAMNVNIYNIVNELRDDRCHMVQSKVQYVFLHEAVLEAYSGRDTRMDLDAMDTDLQPNIRYNARDGRLDTEFTTLCKMRDCQAKPTYTTAKLPENAAKNRNVKTLPNDKRLVYLTEHVKGRNQYINAVYLSSFEKERGFIMTQLPVADTVVDMWRLVVGCGVSTIVSIGRVDKKSKPCYWPQTEGASVQVAPYTVTLQKKSSPGPLHNYALTVTKKDTIKNVDLLHLAGWTGEVPDNIDHLVQLLTTLQAAAKDSAGDKPVIVQCIDGATHSGLVCALSDVISRMTRDQELDVYAAVRQLHAVRPEALTSVTQYRYCYQVAQHFKATRIYANE